MEVLENITSTLRTLVSCIPKDLELQMGREPLLHMNIAGAPATTSIVAQYSIHSINTVACYFMHSTVACYIIHSTVACYIIHSTVACYLIHSTSGADFCKKTYFCEICSTIQSYVILFILQWHAILFILQWHIIFFHSVVAIYITFSVLVRWYSPKNSDLALSLICERGRYLCCRWQPEIQEYEGNQWSVTKNMLQIGLGKYICSERWRSLLSCLSEYIYFSRPICSWFFVTSHWFPAFFRISSLLI